MSQHPLQSLDSITFDHLLRNVSHPDPNGRVAIDLVNTRFIRPSGMVQLTALCHSLKIQGGRPKLIFWTHANDLGGYLTRAGFFDAVSSVSDFNVKPTPQLVDNARRRYGESDVLLEVTMLEDQSELSSVVSKIRAALLKSLSYSREQANNISIAISEVAQNISDHNISTLGFIALQVYGSAGNKFLEIGISDIGEGLRQSLLRNQVTPKTITDHEAILQAVTLGVSEFADSSRGLGLPLLIDLVTTMQGRFHIRSGKAHLTIRHGWKNSRVVSEMAGVHISIILPLARP